MKIITIYTDIKLTEQDLKKLRKKFGNVVYIPHKRTVIEYIERKEININNANDLINMI